VDGVRLAAEVVVPGITDISPAVRPLAVALIAVALAAALVSVGCGGSEPSTMTTASTR